jgi:hypothetical protein
VSLTQLALSVALYIHARGGGDAARTRSLFNAVNKADTLKLILLSGFIGAVCVAARRVGALAAGLIWLGVAASATLLLGGCAFLVRSAALDALLVVSLLLLLVWVAAVAVAIIRGTSTTAAP